jgi:glycogen(starch) synthase
LQDKVLLMRVFMLGWEFPPFISGGLGTACYGLTKAMSAAGTDVIFILPRPVNSPFSTHVRLVAPQPGSHFEQPVTEHRLDEFENVSFHTVDALGSDPYQQPGDLSPMTQKFISKGTRRVETTRHIPSAGNTPVPSFINQSGSGPGAHYAGDMFAEVHRYASLAVDLAKKEEFDVIHAHDWLTYPAGIAVARATGKPLVVHVHSHRVRPLRRERQPAASTTSSGAACTPRCASSRSVHAHQEHLHPPLRRAASKVDVVYNGVDLDPSSKLTIQASRSDDKVVLFLGRITMQKGPEYFIAAAKRVLEMSWTT